MRFPPPLPASCVLLGAFAAAPVRADVTVQESTHFTLSIIKAQADSTEMVSADKQRLDSSLHCEGFMSLVCGNSQGSEIVRLDKDVQWTLDPKKKQYRELHFLSADERRAAEEQARAQLDKLKQCPNAPPAASTGPDTSKCEMSPPKIDARQTDQHANIAGHDTRLSQLALTESCKNRDTGDTCDFLITFDAWLTQDSIPGWDERSSFRSAYLKKLGLDPNDPQVQKQLRQFLAPYQDSLKQLAAHAAQFKGAPLKTVMKVSFGGAQCAAAKSDSPAGGDTLSDAGAAAGSAAASSAAGAAGAAAGQAAANAAGNSVAGSVLGSAANAFGSKLVSGLFAKKAAATPAAPTPATPPDMHEVAEVSSVTNSISAGSIAADQFEVPAGWKLVTPKDKAAPELTCPGTN